MPFTKLVLLYLGTLGVFFAIDLVWLGLIAKGIYTKYLGNLMAPQVNWAAALIFYLLFIVGILVFVVLPALEQGSLVSAVWKGALFGMICYATYDLTNLATLKGWPVEIVIIDMIWGAVLTGAVSTGGYLIGRALV